MKMKLLALSVLFSSLHALAIPPQMRVVVGDFAVTDVYKVLQHRRYELVFTANSQGQERLKQLRAEGYACVAQESGKYFCSIFLQDQNEPPEALDKMVRDQWGGLLISLREPVSAPELVYESSVYSQWNVEQKALVRLGTAPEAEVYYKTMYSINQPDVWKLYIGDPLSDKYYYFLIENFNSLKVVEQYNMTQGNIRDFYLVSIFVQRLK